MWNDIQDAFSDSEEKEYFLGSIIVHSSDDVSFEVIDGQQRITTLTMLFRAIYQCFKTESQNARVEYTKAFGKCI
ncbi:hypothetical protein DMB92_02605 [Campylobacter sp. MIT 99-7217]|nr:hypothetical protein DMB92_02605 [Campylobacter sp. MIT 99-7217]